MQVDMVLVGAEGLVENGGIINRIGTFQMAIVAKSLTCSQAHTILTLTVVQRSQDTILCSRREL